MLYVSIYNLFYIFIYISALNSLYYLTGKQGIHLYKDQKSGKDTIFIVEDILEIFISTVR